jgi:hypothetical protein
MFRDISRGRMVVVWFAGVVAVLAVILVVGAPMNGSTGSLLLLMSLVPPVVLLKVWRGAPPPTVAEVLHTVNAQAERQ